MPTSRRFYFREGKTGCGTFQGFLRELPEILVIFPRVECAGGGFYAFGVPLFVLKSGMPVVCETRPPAEFPF
jgi:hypothetical protein